MVFQCGAVDAMKKTMHAMLTTNPTHGMKRFTCSTSNIEDRTIFCIYYFPVRMAVSFFSASGGFSAANLSPRQHT
jgi:hypothetical protein